MRSSLYRHSCYKEALISIIESKKKAIGRNFTYQALAESCGMQKTYLSRVLRHDAHLNDDQLYALCDQLQLDAELVDFLFLLWSFNRTQNSKRKRELKDAVEELQKRKLKTEGQIPLKPKTLQDDELKIYFLKPQFQVLHLLLQTKAFAGSLEKAAHHLGFSEEDTELFYHCLTKAGIIEVDRGELKIKEDQLHLSESSPLFPIYRDAMRLLGMQRVNQGSSDPYSFSAIFSCSKETKQQIHHSFMDWLRQVKELVDKSPSEEVYQMNFDLMKWS